MTCSAKLGKPLSAIAADCGGCVVVPMPIKGRRQDIDACIADLVAALNAANITTVASCCGHGAKPGSIMLDDGRELIVKTRDLTESARERR